MQNVHTRGNIHGNPPLFGQIAGFLPYLDKARGICYIFHSFRQEAGCAGRSPFFYLSGILVRIFRFYYRRHEGVCLWDASPRADPFFCSGAACKEELR